MASDHDAQPPATSLVDALLAEVRLAEAEPVRKGELIARGGMGAVWTAEDVALQRTVALKALHPEAAGRSDLVRFFVQEARIVASLEHPNIAPVHRLGVNEQLGLHFTMKRVEGQTFKDLASSHPKGPLRPSVVIRLVGVMIKVCDAIAYAHSFGVLHRDLKPANIMVGDYGQVYVMDWGIALRRGDQAAWERPASVLGTPGYLAPEQARGEPCDARTDVWGLGACLYSVLCRRPVFRARDTTDRLAAAREGKRPALLEIAPWVPRRLAEVIERALATAPDERTASARVLREELDRFLHGVTELPVVHADAGDLIVEEGTPAKSVFLLESGAAEVIQHRGGQDIVLRVLGPGEVIGETAVLTASPRTATVRATMPSVLRRLDPILLEEELDGARPWLATLIRNLAERFRDRETRAPAGSHPATVLTVLAAQAGGNGARVRLSAVAARLGLPEDDARSVVSALPGVSVDSDILVLDLAALANNASDVLS